MSQFMKIAAVQLLILAVGLVFMEIGLRLIAPLPVHGGVYIDGDGKHVHVAMTPLLLTPNLSATHAGAEFRAPIHIDSLGYRAISNESTKPDYLFLGDSFTFGHGVGDHEAFADIVCRNEALTCLNLGRSGTNTFQQLNILRYALRQYGVRPKTVVLVMLVACWIDSAGNDLGDNLQEYQERVARSAAATAVKAKSPQDAHAAGWLSDLSLNGLIKAVQKPISNFEIIRRAMLIASGRLKSSVYACSDRARIETALVATRAALKELNELAAQYHFSVKVFAIHPYQELGGSYRQTESDLRAVMPRTFAYFGTGARFRKDQYYPYDGHFNAAGHANMAAIVADDLQLKP